MKPFRVWGTRAAAVALLLVMATNALAIPSRPIDNDPQAPPIPTVFVGDPSDSPGGIVKQVDSDFEAVVKSAFSTVLMTKLQLYFYFAAPAQLHRVTRPLRGVRTR